MYRLFCPYLMVESVHDIDFDQLKDAGVRGVIFDLDNTIIPWDSNQMCPTVESLLRGMLEKGFKVSIVSNNWHSRVKEIAVKLGLPFVSRAYKPAKTGFRKALVEMGLEPFETVVIGDQLFTDVLGGNRMGLRTIWVKPLTAKEFIGTRIHRRFEKLAVKILKAKGLMK